MRKSRLIAVVAAVHFFAAGTALGQDSFGFTQIDRDPVTAGMGFAGTASTSNASFSWITGVSVLPFFAGTADVSFSFQKWAPDGVSSNNMTLGTGFKVGQEQKLGFSVGGTYLTGEEFDLYNDMGVASGTFTPHDAEAGLGIAYLVARPISVGASIRYASQTLLDDYSIWAVCADVSVAYRAKGLVLSAGVSSIPVSVSDESLSAPTAATFGGQWSGTFGGRHGIRGLADLKCFFNDGVTAGAGVEYSYSKTFFLRGGYHYGSDDAALPSFVTLGAGLRFDLFSLDFAYLTADDTIGNTFTVGLGFSF